MLTIRLSRIGKKNKPMYRLVISEKTRDPFGRTLEFLGSYNPHTKELQAKAEKIRYWLNQGSGMSPTVNNLLVEKGIIERPKVKVTKQRKGKKKDKKEAETQEIIEKKEIKEKPEDQVKKEPVQKETAPGKDVAPETVPGEKELKEN